MVVLYLAQLPSHDFRCPDPKNIKPSQAWLPVEHDQLQEFFMLRHQWIEQKLGPCFANSVVGLLELRF